MKRVASQFMFCSPTEILRNSAVELNSQGVVTQIFSLDENKVESAQTLFFDGIISAEIISLKQHLNDLSALITNYQYLDLSLGLSERLLANGKPLILDFGTDSIEDINLQISRLASILEDFSIFEIIAACCYYPAVVIGKTSSLGVNRKARLLIWEGADLIHKKITNNTKIKLLN